MTEHWEDTERLDWGARFVKRHRAGKTMAQISQDTGYSVSRIRLAMKAVNYEPAEHRRRRYANTPRSDMPQEHERAAKQLQREIAAAVAEAPTAPLYRKWPYDA